MTTATTRPFTASTNKFAYAQAFAAPSGRRAERRPRSTGLLHRVFVARGRNKTTRAA